MFQTFQLPVGGFDFNFSYFVLNGNSAAVIDPCGDVAMIRSKWENEKMKNPNLAPQYILLTHAHPDHISGLGELLTFFKAPVCTSVFSVFPGDRKLADLEHLPFGDGFFECLVTKGHSTDSICYRTSDNSALFTGDTLFIGCCGFCRPVPMFESMKHLKKLSDSLIVYSGHNYGEVPYDTLGSQKKTNPYLTAENIDLFRERVRALV